MDISSVFYAAGMVTGIGLLVVFSCLIALIAILVILPKVINRKHTQAKKHSASSIKKAAPAPEIKPETQPRPHANDDYELVAVLTAAAAAMMEAQPGGIIVRSYKRVGPSAWKKSGRDYQILNKF